MKRNIKFVAHAVRWHDKVNGNTYHSVRIERVKDGTILKSLPIIYGYEERYKQTALELMIENGWINYSTRTAYLFERENGYPISWSVRDGLKREMKANVS